jgi:hypothetical protein
MDVEHDDDEFLLVDHPRTNTSFCRFFHSKCGGYNGLFRGLLIIKCWEHNGRGSGW